MLGAAAMAFAMGSPSALAAPKPPKPPKTVLSVVPNVTALDLVNGQLVASGNVTAIVKGQAVTRAFSNIPVSLDLAANQTGAGACPILDLKLGPITLDLLGLVVETSPICLQITAYEGAGLLGDLLCGVADLLNGGLPLDTVLAGLRAVDANALETGLIDLLNGALNQLLGSTVQSVAPGSTKGTCAILHLELGPLDLTLLGLEVILDDCTGGPVVVDITGQTGKGKLLGNLLCELSDGGLLQLGSTLQQILNQFAGL